MVRQQSATKRVMTSWMLLEKKPFVHEGEEITAALAKKLAEIKDLKEVPVRAFLGDKVEHFDAEDEQEIVYAQANTPLNDAGEFLDESVIARINGEPMEVSSSRVTHMDVSLNKSFLKLQL